jgi:hypothetical protein
VAGYDKRRQRDTARRNIGPVLQDPTLDNYLTGEQNLRFHAVASLVQPAVHGHFLRGFHCAGPRVRVPARDAGRPGQQVRDRYRECLAGAIVSTFQGIVILALAGLAHVPHDPILLLIVIGELLLLTFTLTAFGVMMAARIRQVQAFMALTQMLVIPLFFLSGALCPLRSLPAWLSVLTRSDPITCVVYPVRLAVFNHLSISPAASAAPVPGRYVERAGGPGGRVARHRRGDGRRGARDGGRGVPAHRVVPARRVSPDA